MPSPSFDPWFASRRFGIIIDAGSSGSRLQIYSWLDNTNHPPQPILPVVEKGSKDPDNWVTKIEPGISSFAGSPDKISQHLAPLLQHARDYIPPSLHSQTPLFLYATAGMRLLPAKDQTAILEAACDFLRFHSEFRVSDSDSYDNDDDDQQSSYDNVSHPRACKDHVRVISGEEEGLFGWIAVNYLMDAFPSNSNSNSQSPPLSYGFLDMGGASAQIAFKVDSNSSSSSNSLPLIPVTLNLLNGQSIHHDVFVTTWLGYGTNQAREKYVAKISAQAQAHSQTPTPGDAIPDPCLPRGLSMPVYDVGTRQNPIVIENDPEDESDSRMEPSLYLRGTGSFDECISLSAELLLDVNSSSSSSSSSSSNTPPLPLPFPLPLKTTPFVGISEYWYTSEHLFGLGGVYDDAAFEDAAKRFCAVGWKNMEFLYLGLGEGGEFGDSDSDLGYSSWTRPHSKYATKIDVHRLEMQCFKSAWIMNVLHLGLGMPRSQILEIEKGKNREDIVFVGDVGQDDNATTKPMFQSVDTIRDTSISWTLGKMVLEAGREVGRSLKNENNHRQKQKPKVPPHVADTVVIPAADSSTHIYHLSPQHVSSPSSSVSSSSPFVLCLYAVTIVVLFLISYRLGVWYQAKVALRKWWRKGSGQVMLNGIGKLGRYGGDGQDGGGLDENEAEQLEMGVFEKGKQSRFLSVLLSVRRGIFTKFARPTRSKNSEPYPMNRYAVMNGYNNKERLSFSIPNNSDAYNHDYYHRNDGTSLAESASILEFNTDSDSYHHHSKMDRVIHRSASLPVSLSSSSQSQPQSQSQSHSQTQSLYPSSLSSSYFNSPASLSTYTSLSSFPSTTPTAGANGTAGTALTTALTTQPSNHFAQSRSRNSSQVNLLANPNYLGNSTGTATIITTNSSSSASTLGVGVGTGLFRAGSVAGGLQARSANSSQASLVSLKKRAYEYAVTSG